ncbi:cobalt-zinc-cadmium efflux system protein [Microbacterium sp. AK009]|uniref:cation diffusion facilitator family transporter n=1 Tax=Microbacterium sp. AK009 TaxID=2723068 RepID=UPI0015CB2AF7|nr:cation diffusion facilitator family transporter [Microbacterium sp. AK009]NYF17268.1 cobalt-zinc-cadmium efflux system protein [Microbacterium sp. AK009]
MHTHPEPAGGWRSASSRRLLAISLGITATVMVVQVIGAILSGSLALIADAAHMFTDAAGLVIALLAAVVAARPATDRRTYGYQRAEVFGALANGVILIVLAAWVGVEAVSRLMDPGDVEVAGGVMLTVAVIGLIANGAAMWLLSAAQKTNLNVRGAYLEVLGDLLGSIAVIIAAVVIVLTGWAPADAIASLAIAAMIVPRAVALLREVASVLSEAAPRGMEVRDIRTHILGTPGVVDVHDVHVWQLTRGAPVFSAHVVVSPDVIAEGRSDAVLRDLQGCLSEHFDVAHSTFQVEGAGHVERDSHA